MLARNFCEACQAASRTAGVSEAVVTLPPELQTHRVVAVADLNRDFGGRHAELLSKNLRENCFDAAANVLYGGEHFD